VAPLVTVSLPRARAFVSTHEAAKELDFPGAGEIALPCTMLGPTPSPAQPSRRGLARLGGGLVLGGMILACAGRHVVDEVEYHRVIDQTSVVPAPAGLRAIGPMAPSGTLFVEGGVGAGLPIGADQTRAEGALAAWETNPFGRVRAGVAWTDWLEVGMGAGVAPTALGHSLATDLAAPDTPAATGELGLQVRFAGPVGERGHVILSTELDVVGVPYVREEHRTDSAGGAGAQDDRTDGTQVIGQGRAGLGFLADLGRTSFGAGLSAQVTPVLIGHQESSWSCTRWSDGSQDCDAVPDPHALERPITLGTFLVAGVRMSPNTLLLGQAWWNITSEEEALVAATPFGAALTVRVEAPPPGR
jgi:hypothetical protein